MGNADQARIEALITDWGSSLGAAERANFQGFIEQFVAALDLPSPTPATDAYRCEAPVPGGSFNRVGESGSADLYRRGAFVMEAKQSKLKAGEVDQADMFTDAPVVPLGPSGSRYDRMMIRAQAQAKNYAVNLPGSEPAVPFLIVCDVGRAFEIFYDFAGNGRGYGFFPDAKGYRIPLARLREPEVQALFRDIWLDPRSRDPKLRSAEVTRDVSKRLAAVSAWLEETQRAKNGSLSSSERSLAVEETALFVMRLLFCMFAEDIGLLPERRFSEFLSESVEDDRNFDNGLIDLWSKMNDPHGNRWAWAVRDDVRYFNGGLFETAKTYRLGREERGELLAASRYNWRGVEPAIFGTLLEQALSVEQRAQLGAHYTPRAYVERLVDATIMEVLNAEWADAQDRLTDPAVAAADAAGVARVFHERLACVTVLDPACGTGNFLYVAMEAVERLEAQVIEVRRQLGESVHSLITPAQFLGLEKNPRAAKIAELVLWIGWLRFRIDNDPDSITDPVLAKGGNINFGRPGGYDAVLDEATGLIPAWPDAEFIVGNPPFKGGANMRSQLEPGYAEALWRANRRVPKSADFVMQWWDRAAHTLVATDTKLRRFGFVTTNSITQSFSRRVIEGYLSKSFVPAEAGGSDNGTRLPEEAPVSAEATPTLSLVYAIPDHPWTRATDGAAAVRIAMTVAQVGAHAGRRAEVVREAGLASDSPVIEVDEVAGIINADLTVGTDVTAVVALRSNDGLASPGVKLHGAGFIVTTSEAKQLGFGEREGLGAHIRPYRNGRDLLQASRGKMVIDFLGLSEADARQRFNEAYQHILARVYDYEVKDKNTGEVRRDGRKYNARSTYRENWWIFGEPRAEMRPMLSTLPRYIATVETSKHRIFQFLDAEILPDNMLIAIGSDDAFHLGVLSSAIHLAWTAGIGGTLEDRERYNKIQGF